MKIDIVAIPKPLLLLHLYNNALYKSPKFDGTPTIRQKVTGKKDGMYLLAAHFIGQNHQNITEVDLGAGA